MKMRTGTMVGKNDSRLNGIKVGDQLRSNLIDLVGHVDNYGCIRFPNGDKVAPTEWDGADYTIISDDEVNAVDEPALGIVEPDVDGKATEETDWQKEAEYWKSKYDEITISEFSSTSLVAELRHRGYDVKCTRTIVEEL